MKTFTLHTVLVKGRDGKWCDYNAHGVFADAARDEAQTLVAQGVVTAIRTDTHQGKKVTTQFERITPS